MFDSWGKIPVSILRGNRFAMGNYEQCKSVNTQLPEPYGLLEGQYCRATFSTNSSYQNVNIILPVQSGICIPKVCKPKDLEEKFSFLISNCKVQESIPLDSLDYVTM